MESKPRVFQLTFSPEEESDHYKKLMDKYPDAIFVYGANLRGRHGKGAAKEALNYGAVEGKIGYSGRSYGIPTKNENIRTMSLSEIAPYVDEFIVFVKKSSEKMFVLTRIGCGLANHPDEEMVKLFNICPANVVLPLDWRQFMVLSVYGSFWVWSNGVKYESTSC